MKTLLEKSVRDGMPLSHKLMLACLVVFTLTLFFPYSTGEGGFMGGYWASSVLIITPGHSVPPAGTGWELAQLAVPVLLVLFVLYLGDPDENVPLFRQVGWWITPFVPFLTISIAGFETPALVVGLFAEAGMLVAAALHLFEQFAARKKAAGSSPPAAPKP
ncbi:MAG: hypothetical protein Q8M47_14335 [Devosia sp.]|nr:hypothetical protein [Devosia sp.]